MNLQKQQLKFQMDGLEALKEKFEKHDKKNSTQYKSQQVFIQRYLKPISKKIEEEIKDGLQNITKKLYILKKTEIEEILEEEISNNKLETFALDVVEQILELVSLKKITCQTIYKKNIKNSKLILWTYNIFINQLSDIDNTSIKIKQANQLMALVTLPLSSYEIVWIVFSSILQLLSKNLQDDEDNSTSRQALSKTIAEALFEHIAYRMKNEEKKIVMFENEEIIKLGANLLKYLIDFEVVEEYKKEGSNFEHYAFTDEFEKSSQGYYKDIAKYATPFFEPMIVPPLHWKTIDDGGFLKDKASLTKYDLYIMKTKTKKARANLEAQRESFPPKLLQAINIIQDTKWQINKTMFSYIFKEHLTKEQISKEFLKEKRKELKALRESKKEKKIKRETKRETLEELGIDAPTIDEKLLPLNEEFQSIKKQIKKIKLEISEEKNSINASKFLLDTAKKYQDYGEIYFVWQIDFRGRVYPVQTLLNPQGDDMVKSLLHFAQKKSVDEKALQWFKIHGANCYGEDKISFNDRIKWVDKHSEEILRIFNYENPLQESSFLKKADKKYQFLAFAIEYKQYVQDPHQFKSSLPIAIDGSNNGFQHISALLRDVNGAKKVNVLPSGDDVPADIYQEVANQTKAILKKEMNDFDATSVIKQEQDGRSFIKDILPLVNRSMVKKGVMTDSYGAGLKAKTEQIVEYLEDEKIQSQHNLSEKEIKLISKIVAQANEKSIDAVAPSSQKYKKWMKNIAKQISEQNKPIIWTTPFISLKVIQEEFETVKKQISTKYNNKDNKMQILLPTDKIDKDEQTKGIAPNFIHSLDSTHMYMSLLLANERGVDAFATIHDSFATHAQDVDLLLSSLKDAFTELTKYDVAKHFKEEMQMRYNLQIEEIPYVNEEDFDIELIRDAKYFFS